MAVPERPLRGSNQTMWYAQNPGRRNRQLLGDGAVLLWTALWTRAAVVAYRLACLLTRPPPEAPPPPIGDPSRLPLVGDRVDAALRAAADIAGAGDPVTVRAAVIVAPSPSSSYPSVSCSAAGYPPSALDPAGRRRPGARRELRRPRLLACAPAAGPGRGGADRVRTPDATAGGLAEGWRAATPTSSTRSPRRSCWPRPAHRRTGREAGRRRAQRDRPHGTCRPMGLSHCLTGLFG